MVHEVGNVVFNRVELRPMASSSSLRGDSGCRRQLLVADRMDARVEATSAVVWRLTARGILFDDGSGCRLWRLVVGGRSSAPVGSGGTAI
ncbi:uncharacterized protein DS421_10g316180 [Arachis hypogaea]|nr:uncharacterized protein DS421_10g316180 [Arachis hypogaea]